MTRTDRTISSVGGAPDWDNAGTALGNGDTISENGWVVVTFYVGNSGDGWSGIYINGKLAADCGRSTHAAHTQPAIIPVNKGDKITWSVNNAGPSTVKFYPCKS